MEYHVGKLANLFDLSAQTLHYYEKLGLLKSYRNQSNGYRYYDESGLQQLGTIKKMRNAGFDLKNSTFVYNQINEEVIYQEYTLRKQEAIQEMLHQQKIIQILDENIQALDKVQKNKGFEIVEYDGFFRFDLGGKETDLFSCGAKKEVVSEWYQNLFYTATSMQLEFGDEVNFSYGLLITKMNFYDLNFQDDAHVMKIDKGRFASKTLRYYNRVDFASLRSQIEEFLNQNPQESLRMLPITKHIFSYIDEDKNKVNIIELLLPLK